MHSDACMMRHDRRLDNVATEGELDMIEYRMAKKDDVEALTPLIMQFKNELSGFMGRQKPFEKARAKKECEEYIEGPFAVYVAEKPDKTLVGYIVCRISGDVVFAESLYVLEDYRRQGIGSRLYDLAEALAMKKGNETLYNWIHPNNDGVIALLKSKGYTTLNLIENRKPLREESTKGTIKVGNHTYDY